MALPARTKERLSLIETTAGRWACASRGRSTSAIVNNRHIISRIRSSDSMMVSEGVKTTDQICFSSHWLIVPTDIEAAFVNLKGKLIRLNIMTEIGKEVTVASASFIDYNDIPLSGYILLYFSAKIGCAENPELCAVIGKETRPNYEEEKEHHK